MKNWTDRANKAIPCGAQTYSKSSRYFTKPFFVTQALGCKVVTDENTIHMNKEYTDYSMALGAVILGYYPAKWYTNDAPAGIIYSVSHPLEVKLAEKLIDIIPSAEMVKFFKNGSDATEIAVRLARAYTNKEIVLYGGYHGFHDWSIGTNWDSRGIHTGESHNVKDALNGNLISSLKETACIIIEPTHPDIVGIFDLAREYDIVLVFDEVLTGFRYDVGGLQKILGITPDLTCLGKCMANGMPLSAVVGKREIMKLLEGEVFGSSTFGGETISLISALQTIKELEKSGSYLWGIGERWKHGAVKYGFEIIGLPPRCGFKFDLKQQSIYQDELLKRGILVNGINNFCLAHENTDIDYYLECLEEVMPIVKKGEYNGREINPIFKR